MTESFVYSNYLLRTESLISWRSDQEAYEMWLKLNLLLKLDFSGLHCMCFFHKNMHNILLYKKTKESEKSGLLQN